MSKSEGSTKDDWWSQGTEVLKSFRTIPKTLMLIWETNPKYASLAVMIGLAQSNIPLINIWLAKVIVDHLVASTGEFQSVHNLLNIASSAAAQKLWWLLGTFTLLEAVSSAIEPSRKAVDAILSSLIMQKVKVSVMRKANEIEDLSEFDGPNPAATHLTNEDWRIPSILQSLIWLWNLGTTTMVVATSLVLCQPLLMVFIVLGAIPSVIVEFQNSREMWRQSLWRSPEGRRMSYFSQTVTQRGNIPELRLFSLGEFFVGRFLQASSAFIAKEKLAHKKRATKAVFLRILFSLFDRAAYAIIAFKTLAGKLTLGDFYIQTNYTMRLYKCVSEFIWAVSGLYEHCQFLNTYFEFMEKDHHKESTPKESENEWKLQAPAPIAKGIEFKNVKFHYANSDYEVLKDINFTIKPGQKVALVGENGAGKTTLVKILSCLYKPSAGEILVDGIKLSDIDVDSWRAQIGVIFQDFAQYNLTIGENIGLGNVNFIEDEQRISEAAKRGGAHDFISKLDNAYDSNLRAYYEEDDKHTNLSGGQWQKIALSRLFMRVAPKDESYKDGKFAQVLILDEPTASLDVESEHELFVQFQELTKGKTTVLISHRFSTVRMADLIMYLANGEITEQGSHDELMALKGEYARLYKLQADKYAY